jgi:phenylpropionate dioxygenase-like ring-hydroxylating dioxygenase large terminal subunit
MSLPIRHDTNLHAIAALVDDRPAEHIFQINRRAFVDPEVYEAEMRHIFEATWVFVGLESQIPNPHDFITTHIGRHPVLLSRDKDNKICCLLNTCRHRGTVVCPFKHGNRKLHVCRYHAWSYDSGGHNVAIPERAAGQYPAAFDDADHDLIRVARLDSYRGFIFASLSADVPELDDFLGETRPFLDLVIDQSPTGRLEVVPGEVTYTFDANWKLQFENGLDYYHFGATHPRLLCRHPEEARRGCARGSRVRPRMLVSAKKIRRMAKDKEASASTMDMLSCGRSSRHSSTDGRWHPIRRFWKLRESASDRIA